MLGFSDKNVLEGELNSGALNAQGTRFDWDFGDDVRAFTYGLFGKDYSRETLRRKAIEEQTRRINEEVLAGTNTDLSAYGPGLSLTRKPGETASQAQARGRNAVGLQKAIAEAKINNPGLDLEGVTTIGDLTTRISGKKAKEQARTKQIQDEDRKEERDRYWTEREALRNERIQARQDRKDGLTLQLAEMAATRESGERADIRAIEASLEKAHLDNARLLEVEENRRLDRKEKAMMAMISGGTDALAAAFGVIM